ncbi:NTP transferase domain-containing protein [Patescibacteria group bacterium]|nr:NTP transferase domain-containing protein [Patescibacteria group bacterium]
MKAILLGAGISRRIKPLADKNFLEFLGRPLIKLQVKRLMDAGFDQVIVVGGRHNLQKLEELFTQDDHVQVIEQQDLSLGMAGAVLSCEPLIMAGESIVVVSSNDVFSPDAFSKILKAKEHEKTDGALLGYKVSEYFPGGYLKTDDSGKIQSIVEKPEPGKEPSNLVNLVVHYHRDALGFINEIKNSKSENDDLYEVAIDNLIQNGASYYAVSYNDYWQPIKYPWHILKVWKHFMPEKMISESSEVHESAVIKGEVIIEDGVKVFENAVISGPAYIGKNSIIANNALVRDSYIGSDCVIGFSTEIARSYLCKQVWTHKNYIGDSVIGQNVSFGSGAVTANLRLDEGDILINIDDQKISTGSNKFGAIIGDDVRIGINTSIMPGIKIGTNSVIGSGIVISGDVPDNKFVNGKWDLEIKENKLKLKDINRKNLLNSLKKK